MALIQQLQQKNPKKGDSPICPTTQPNTVTEPFCTIEWLARQQKPVHKCATAHRSPSDKTRAPGKRATAKRDHKFAWPKSVDRPDGTSVTSVRCPYTLICCQNTS